MPITQDITDLSLCTAGTDGGTITTTNLSAGTLSGMDLGTFFIFRYHSWGGFWSSWYSGCCSFNTFASPLVNVYNEAQTGS